MMAPGTKSDDLVSNDCSWKFGDASNWNPWRWSDPLSFKAAIKGLRAVKKRGDRKIALKVPADASRKLVFDNCETAIQCLKDKKKCKQKKCEQEAAEAPTATTFAEAPQPGQHDSDMQRAVVCTADGDRYDVQASRSRVYSQTRLQDFREGGIVVEWMHEDKRKTYGIPKGAIMLVKTINNNEQTLYIEYADRNITIAMHDVRATEDYAFWRIPQIFRVEDVVVEKMDEAKRREYGIPKGATMVVNKINTKDQTLDIEYADRNITIAMHDVRKAEEPSMAST